MNACPIGWGYPKDYPIEGVTAKSLPDLPLLERICDPRMRNNAVIEAIRSVPGLVSVLRPVDLIKKYGLPQATAAEILHRAKRA